MGNFFTDIVDGVTPVDADPVNQRFDELDKAITYNRPALVTCDGDVTWDSSTGTLAWSDVLRVIFNRADGTAILNTVASGSVTIADGQFARLTLSEYADTVLTMDVVSASPGSASNFLDPQVFILAYRNAASDELVSIGLGDLLMAKRVVDLENAVAGAGSGTVTSVAATVPTDEFDVTGSPITGSGTLAITKKTQAANTVWAGPSSGADAAPGFRALTDDDLPTVNFTASISRPGPYEASQVLAQIAPTFACSIAAALAGSIIIIETNPTSEAVLSLTKNGTEFGTITIATGGTVTMASTSGVELNGTGDYIEIVAPATADSTLSISSINLAMTKGV